MESSNPTKASLLNDEVSSLRRRNRTLILIFFALIFILALIIGAVIIHLVSDLNSHSRSQSLADSNPALDVFCFPSYSHSACVASLFPRIQTRPDLNPSQVFAISLETSREKLSRIISTASDGDRPEPALRNCSKYAGRAMGRILNSMRVDPVLETGRRGDLTAWIDAAAEDLTACAVDLGMAVESTAADGLRARVDEVRGLLGYGREYVINCEGVNENFSRYGGSFRRGVDESWRDNRMVEDLAGVSLFGLQYFVLVFLFCLLVRNY